MKLIVGLGNPGPKYEATRHNAGFLMLDVLADEFRVDWQGKKFDADIGKGTVYGETCLFMKPLTFMNLSGKSVAKAMRFYKIAPEDVIVIHDDIDLGSAKVKSKAGGGHGGHNGIRSIMAETGQKDFHRIKIGVGRPEEEKGCRMGVSDWVLRPMSDAELMEYQQDILKDVLLRLKNILER